MCRRRLPTALPVADPAMVGRYGSSGHADSKAEYTISAGFDEQSHPAKLLLTHVPAQFDGWLRARASELGIEVLNVPTLPENVETDDSPASPAETTGTGKGIDDIIVLGADAELVEKASPNLASYGVLAVIADKPMERKVNLDVGRIHYNRWLYIGSHINRYLKRLQRCGNPLHLKTRQA